MTTRAAPTPRLPIPPLADTCRRYLEQLRPLLDEEAFLHTETLVRQFGEQAGPPLQAALQAFDADMATQDKSWLSDAWLDSYLRIRTPLPLASNIGIAVPTHGNDLADWVAALARVCADYHHQRIEAPRAPTGAPVCMAQWQILQGSARLPRAGIDAFQHAPKPGRHIGVLHNGFYYRLAVLDERGEALPSAALRPALAAIRADNALNPQPIAVPCYLGSEQAAPVLATLAANHANNARLLAWIHEDLFHVCLRDDTADEDTELARASFVPDQDVWCYKPISLIHNAATDRLHLHCEHSWEDGGTLLGIFTHAVQRLQTPEHELPDNHPPMAAQDISAWRQGWQLADEQRQAWPDWQATYAASARAVHLRSLLIPFGPTHVPAGISHDALMQFVLQYAQLATWGTVRNTYEAVDASHFLRGRTECVRPVSPPSRAFVASLLANAPDADALAAALAEHKTRIKASKQGLGPNRHLLGLQLMAQRQQQPMPALFDDPGYRVFTTDILSTSTLGRDDIMRNFGFAPTADGGLGINYTLTGDGWLYTVTHVGDRPAGTDRFMQTLADGAQRLLAFVASHQNHAST